MCKQGLPGVARRGQVHGARLEAQVESGQARLAARLSQVGSDTPLPVGVPDPKLRVPKLGLDVFRPAMAVGLPQ